VRTRRLLAVTLLAVATAVAPFALAQTRGKPAAKPPAAKPAPAKADAQAPAPASTSEDTSAAGAATGAADGGAGTATGAGATPEPPPSPELGDGGLRASPLNPTAQEMPGSAADAGAPIDYDRLLADIAALRARVAAVSDNMYQSRVAVAVQTDGDHGKIARLTVAIDDGIVYTAPASFAASDATTVYDHSVAPGRHAVTVDVERKDDRDESFRTSQRNRFTVEVPRDHRVEVLVKIIDDSSMGKEFPADRSGKYDLRVKVKAVARPAGK